MFKVVFLRHGESEWNKKNLFTGWTDVDLSEKGLLEAKTAGRKLKKAGFSFDLVYASFLKRVIKTAHLSLEELDQLYLPVIKDWRLNERHYGNLQGLNKSQTARKFGKEQFQLWRRSYEVRPPAITTSNKFNQNKDECYHGIKVPQSESLKDVVARVVPWWSKKVWPEIEKGKKLLIVASGNSLRALIKHIDNISDEDIAALNIPTGLPLVYEFDKTFKVVKKYYLASKKELDQALNKTASQGQKK
jgi:2,3-bisphosphoglycerate-dependent phosphoglycerate mutase